MIENISDLLVDVVVGMTVGSILGDGYSLMEAKKTESDYSKTSLNNFLETEAVASLAGAIIGVTAMIVVDILL